MRSELRSPAATGEAILPEQEAEFMVATERTFSHIAQPIRRFLSALSAILRALLTRLRFIPRAATNSWRRPWADIGVIAGTSRTRIVLPWKGVCVEACSALAVDPVSARIVAVGDRARAMEGRARAPITVVHPFHHSVVADIEGAALFLKVLLKRAGPRLRLAGTRAVVAVPTDATPLERLGLREAVQAAGARSVLLVDEGLAAALGAGVSMDRPRGVVVVNIGAGTTHIAVTALGGIVSNRSIPVGGDNMDGALIAWLKRHHHIWVGAQAAEGVKRRIGSAVSVEQPATAEISGRDLFTGLPRTVTISSNDVYAALEPVLHQIGEEVRRTIGALSNEMLDDVRRQGIGLTGGTCALSGLEQFIRREVQVGAVVVRDPEKRVALGIQRLLEDKKMLRRAVLAESPAHTPATSANSASARRARPMRLAVSAGTVVAAAILLALRPPLQTTHGVAPAEAVLAPAVEHSMQGLHEVSSSVRNAWQGIVADQALRARLSLLEAQLSDSAGETRRLTSQNRQLTTLLGLKARARQPSIAARVTLRDPTGWLSTIVLDKGTADGVKPGMAVSSAQGLIGQVIWAGPGTSRARLLTGPNAIAACKVPGANATGVLYGTGEATCHLRYLDPDAPLRKGDAVVTSGLDGIYPAEIPVGRVSELHPSRDTIYRTVEVKPSARIESATAVLLLPHHY